jgi:hypothetical protein
VSTLSVGIQYRPVRIGWCVQTDNLDQWRTAVRLTHSFEGGKFNPIIPVDAPEQLAESLVDLFRVDLLYPVANVETIAAFVSAHSYLPWPDHDQRLFWDAWNGRPGYAAFVDVYHAARRIYEDAIEGVQDPKVHASLIEWQEGDPLANVLLATVGSYCSPSTSIPDYARLLREWLRAETLQIDNAADLPANLNRLLSPSRLTESGLEVLGADGEPGVYFGLADNFTDLVNFWNLRAAGIEVVFADPQHLKRLAPMIGVHRAWLKKLPPKPWRSEGALTVWMQEGRNPEDASVLGVEFVQHPVSVHSWNGLNIKPVTAYWEEHDVLGSIDESAPTPAATFLLPKKPVYEERLLHAQRIGVSIRGFDRFLLEKNVTFFPPYLPTLNEYYGQRLSHELRETRSEHDDVIHGAGIAIFAGISQSQVTLTSISAMDLITQVFKSAGVTAKPSQAGLITSRLIAQMGGLQGCRVFKIEGVRSLVEMHSPQQHFDRTLACKVIGNFDETTGRMRFEPYQDLYLGPRPHTRKLQPQDVLDDLLRHKVFRVGLELECPRCKLSFWQPLDDLATEVECQFCGSEFDVTLQLRHRNWAYRRSGLFGRDDHQEGGIPVAVTLQQLESNIRPLVGFGLLFTACLDLTPTTAAIQACETDFAVMTTGHSYERRRMPQIVIGECKAAGGEITRADAEHLARVADALPRRWMSTFIVFAKAGPFLPVEVEAAAAAQHPWTPRVILLSKDELEPYDIFERHPEVERMMRVQGLEGLAQFSVDRYPALRPARLPPPAPPAQPEQPAPAEPPAS